MRKFFSIILITLLFCTTIFADDYVVTNTKGTVKYKTSDGVFEQLKVGDIITSETVINVALGSELLLKGENQIEYKVKSMHYGTVEKLILTQKDPSVKSVDNSKNIIITRMNVDPISDPDE